MSTMNLQIDEILKLKLNSLMEQFESHRVFNNKPIFEKAVIKKEDIVKEITAEKIVPKEIVKAKVEKKKDSFFHKFFFSEY